MFLPGEFHGQRSLGELQTIELAMTEQLTLSLLFFMILLLNISITYMKRSFFYLTRVKRYFLSAYTGDVQGGETKWGTGRRRLRIILPSLTLPGSLVTWGKGEGTSTSRVEPHPNRNAYSFIKVIKLHNLLKYCKAVFCSDCLFTPAILHKLH